MWIPKLNQDRIYANNRYEIKKRYNEYLVNIKRDLRDAIKYFIYMHFK